MRFDDYSRATRSHTIAEPTANTQTVLAVASALLSASQPMIGRRGLTLVGVALSNLADQGAFQLVLPFNRARELDLVVDQVRERFGSGAITRGVLVGREPGLSVPLLPD